MKSALPTGVKSCGVATGLDSELLNLMPELRSKSQTLIGVSLSGYTHRMFSGFRSLWAIPGKRKSENFRIIDGASTAKVVQWSRDSGTRAFNHNK